MIGTNWDEPIEIIGYCGKHAPEDSILELVLVRCKGESGIFHAFARSLVSPGGWNEIDAAVDAAPEITLSPGELKTALREAE